MEGRRGHIFQEHTELQKLAVRERTIFVDGADFIDVERVTELEHFFPQMKLIIDFVPKCLGPLPEGVVHSCFRCVHGRGIKEFDGRKLINFLILSRWVTVARGATEHIKKLILDRAEASKTLKGRSDPDDRTKAREIRCQ